MRFLSIFVTLCVKSTHSTPPPCIVISVSVFIVAVFIVLVVVLSIGFLIFLCRCGCFYERNNFPIILTVRDFDVPISSITNTLKTDLPSSRSWAFDAEGSFLSILQSPLFQWHFCQWKQWSPVLRNLSVLSTVRPCTLFSHYISRSFYLHKYRC